MAPTCGVCHTEESKYKCPICELRYCSISCYKQHKPIHETQPDTTESNHDISQPKKDRPGTKQRTPKIDFTGFENDSDFKRLITRYPCLKVQLQTIYGLTLEPGPDETRTWNRQPLPGLPRPTPPFRGDARGRGRGRGDRGFKTGRGGFESTALEERQHGPWTQQKGDKEAMDVMKRIRESGGGEDEASEGMREFVELCQIRFGESSQS